MDKKSLGNFIKKRRTELNITQVDIAESLGISTQAISKWENGFSYPDFIILGDLANILKVNINDLLTLKHVTSKENNLQFNYLSFGETINKYLKYNNLTQSDLVKKTGINQSTISNIINGKSYPTIDQFITIADVFRVSYYNLYYSIYEEKEIKEIIKINKRKLSIIISSFSLVAIIIGSVIGVISYKNNNPNNSILNKNYKEAFINNEYYPHIEFWDENDNLIDAQRIPYNYDILYYPECDSVMGWNKEFKKANTSTIFKINKNPYKYYFYIYSDKQNFSNGYDSIEDFSNFDFRGANFYLKDIFKNHNDEVIDIYSLKPGIYTLKGETAPILIHTISFPSYLNIEPIKISDCDMIPDLPIFATNEYVISGFKYDDKALIPYSKYTFEKSIEAIPITHNQTTYTDENGYITYLESSDETIVIPDYINDIQIKGIKSKAIKLKENNKKLLFLNKTKLNCTDVFANEHLLKNIKEIELKYQFLNDESSLGNIEQIDNFYAYQQCEDHLDYGSYMFKQLSSNENFHINNLYINDFTTLVFYFQKLNVDDVYIEPHKLLTEIRGGMFSNSTIKRFHMNLNTITSYNFHIGAEAFYNCKNLESFIFPENTILLDGWQFYGCENLKDVTFYGNIDKLSDNMFYGTKIEDLYINNVDFISKNAFNNTQIKNIEISNVKEVEDYCYLPESLNNFYLGGIYEKHLSFDNKNNNVTIHYIDHNIFDINKFKTDNYKTCVNCLCRHKGDKNDYWIINKK